MLTDDYYCNGSLASFDEDPTGGRDCFDDEFRLPKCGGMDFVYGQNIGCPGCQLCFPPDRECKPTGFGFERYESPAWKQACEMMWWRVQDRAPKYTSAVTDVSTPWGLEKGGHWRIFATDADWQYRLDCFDRLGGKEWKRRWLKSERVWNLICAHAETHAIAVERFKQQANNE